METGNPSARVPNGAPERAIRAVESRRSPILLELDQTREPTQAAAQASSTLAKNGRPSREGPVSASTLCSGCGISPTTLPRSLLTPAMSCSEPLGLPSR